MGLEVTDRISYWDGRYKRTGVIIEIAPDGATEENYLSIRKAYRQAVKEGKEEVTWEEHGLDTDYVKYLLEYMETFAIIQPLIDNNAED